MSLLEEIRLVRQLAQQLPIKSIQRGTVSATTGGTAVTISPVDTLKTIVNVASGRTANDTVVLTNSTTITVTTSTNGNVNWQVVEYQ